MECQRSSVGLVRKLEPQRIRQDLNLMGWKLGWGGRNLSWDVRTGEEQESAGVGRGWAGILRLGNVLVQFWGAGVAK